MGPTGARKLADRQKTTTGDEYVAYYDKTADTFKTCTEKAFWAGNGVFPESVIYCTSQKDR